MRVVSLLPAATEIVAALGALGRLVGVSHECDFPPEVRSLPRVTRTRIDLAMPSGAIDRALAEAKGSGVSPVEVDVDLVAHLRPDVLIGQSLCDVCAVGEGELARLVTTLIPTPWVVTLHAHTLDEVFLDIRKVGEVLELRDEAEELEAGLRYHVPGTSSSRSLRTSSSWRCAGSTFRAPRRSLPRSRTGRRGRCSGGASSFSTATRILPVRDPASWTRLRCLPG